MADTGATPTAEILIAQTEAEKQQCIDVRIAVFHLEQKFPLETEIDEFDEGSIHFLLRLTPSLVPIGTIRVTKQLSKDRYKLSRLAVLQEYRRYRYGRALLLALHEWVKMDARNSDRLPGFAEIICHSQLPVKGFYAKFGYQPEGDEFDEEGDPHQKMVARLPLDH